MSEKITGYGLLIMGILVMGLAALSVYQVLTGQGMPAQFLDASAPTTFNLSLPVVPGGPPVDVPLDLGNSLPLGRLINTSMHVVLMGFIVSIGYKLASLGTNLIRPIVVKTREQ